MEDKQEHPVDLVQMSHAIGRIEGMLDSLTGDNGRIALLEKESDRNWWMTVLIAPLLTLGHAIARRFGLDI